MLLRFYLDFADLMSPVSSNIDVKIGESSKLKAFSTLRATFLSWSENALEYMSDVSNTSTSLIFIDFLGFFIVNATTVRGL